MIAIFLFYKESIGKAARFSFSKILAHSSVITFDGDHYVYFDSNTSGHHYRILKEHDGAKILRNITRLPELARIITINIEDESRTTYPWFFLGVRSCNEFCRYLTGIDVGLTFNPRDLYLKLLKYRDKGNYQIIHWWRRKECETTVIAETAK